jgi:hypothetical protein
VIGKNVSPAFPEKQKAQRITAKPLKTMVPPEGVRFLAKEPVRRKPQAMKRHLRRWGAVERSPLYNAAFLTQAFGSSLPTSDAL